MADVVKERGRLRDRALLERHAPQLAALLEERDGESGEMVGAERVLEPRVSGAGVDEVRQPELPNVPEPLENGRVDELQGERVDTDVVPQRISNDHGALVGTGNREPCRVLESRFPVPRSPFPPVGRVPLSRFVRPSVPRLGSLA